MKHRAIAIDKIPSPLPFQTPGEEIANAILHGIGVLLGIAGLVILIVRANGFIGGRGAGSLAVVSFSIYTASIIILFLSSTLYHAIQHEGAKRVFRVLDHSAIYLLIAGTYTPFCLLVLPGALGWTLFGFEWLMALTGITLYSIGFKYIKKVELAVYILMGWAIIMSWKVLVQNINLHSLILLFCGGLAYTMGTIWYTQKIRRGAHVTWHVFVLLAAILHWFSVFFIS